MPAMRLVGCLVLLVLTAARGGAETIRGGDALAFAPAGAVACKGWIGEEIERCRRGRILAQSIPDLVGPFADRQEDRMWRCEFWGKWFTSAALAYRYRADDELKKVLDRAVAELLATQTSDGAITTYKPAVELAHWDVWGRKYTLLGLLAYYDLTGDKKVLSAARRHADRLIEQIDGGGKNIAELGWWTGMAASSVLEPMVLLYNRTGDARYLRFAESIVAAWQTPKGPDLVRKALAGTSVFAMFPGPDPKQKGYASGGQSKAYEMMSCYEGLVELHRVARAPAYRQAAENVFGDILRTEITVLGSGSSWERWCRGRTRQAEPVPEWMETCVTVTWMKLAAQLLRLSGESSYADEIERSTYNALLAAQKDDGSWWCHYNPLEGGRVPAPEHCKMHQNCCVANGPRGLMLLPCLAVMTAADGPVVNFFEPATFEAAAGKAGKVRLEIAGAYPQPGPVEIAVDPAAAAEFTLALRIPAWSRTTTVRVNGAPVDGAAAGRYLRLARTWRPGDKVTLAFDFAPRVVDEPGGSGRVAIERGPIVFATDKRLAADVPAGATIQRGANGTVEATAVAAPAGIRMALDLKLAAPAGATLRLCDYASAGHTWTPASALRVWLPLGEKQIGSR